ncbi:MBL fold metallo-hydrolase [Nitrospirillum iridis]|uniref:Glyoxylase-like metal-dependent hydrolase (Beta-lactamase superfamily II) n=1 Tax=Nitrospirillum iridis TaxID=765888 RepID=A0A7X0EC92_9PROT|nr:MBL fold metallo-hydrolase [Nitrospirillum iridis]MBB6250890.1 glyoxylase-like metal-dependent hydrolase (beta-lactamase superfamily II) [Nitrospirillum iridis]
MSHLSIIRPIIRTAGLLLTVAIIPPLTAAASPVATQQAPLQATVVQPVSQGADIHRLKIGDVPVTALSDGSVPIDLHSLLKRTTPAKIDALLARAFQTTPTEASINAFLIELPGHLVLVDTGVGEMFGPGLGGKLPESLSRAGFTPDQITDILITHAHSDHAGGLVHQGQRVFPNATVHVGKADLDFFFDRGNAARTHYDIHYFDVAATALKPYLDAGKVKPIAADGEVLPGITATLHAGHTPGSAFFTLTSRGQALVFVGDIVHSAAVQFPEPATTIAFDQDEDRAAAVRAQAFRRFTEGGTLIAVPHMPFPGIGHVRADGAGYAWVPVDYVNRAGN